MDVESRWVWTGEDCPRGDCDGDLQQQDRFNVTCLTCKGVWSHAKTETKHYLQAADFERVAEKPRAVADGGVSRFEEHPVPDRFFMQIEPAEIEMQPMDHDDVTFKSQLVPGGSFAVELSARYSYAGRDCTQCISLGRDAVEDLHQRLGEVLEADHRE